MAASKVLTLDVSVTGLPQARAQLRDFVATAKKAGVEVEKEAAKGRDTKERDDRRAAQTTITIEKRKAAQVAIIEARARTKDVSAQKKHTAEIARLTERAAQQESKEIRKELRRIESARIKAFEAQQRRLKTQAKSHSNLLKNLAGLGAAYLSLGAASRIFSAAKEGAQLAGLQQAFEATGGTAADLEGILKSLGNTVSKRVALQMANTAQVFGFAQKEIEKFGQIALAASTKLGVSTEQLFSDIVRGTARASKPILDNLGLLIEAKVANAKYATQLGINVKLLSDVQKKQAFVNEVMAQGNKIIAGAPINQLAQQLGSVDAELKNILDTAKLIAAERVGDLLAALGRGRFVTHEGTADAQTRRQAILLRARATGFQAGAARRQVFSEEEILRALASVDITGVGDAGKRRANIERLARNDTTRIEAQRQIGNFLAEHAVIAEREVAKIDARNAAAKKRAAFLKAEQEEIKAEAIEFAKAEKELDQLAKDRIKRNRKARAERLKSERAHESLRVKIERVQEATAKKALEDLLARGALRLKAEREANEIRLTFIANEAQALQDVLNTRKDLDEFTRARLARDRDRALSGLPAGQQAAFREQQADTLTAGAAGANLGTLIQANLEGLDPDRIAAIGRALEEGIATPLMIAADAAGQFGRGMADAAAAAIFEGKSVRKATNEILKQLTRRATALAIFEAAAALASLAIPGGQAAAVLHGKAAATYAGLAVVTGIGAAATGGVFESGGGAATPATGIGGPAPRTVNDGRVRGGTSNIYYITYAPQGLRDTVHDQDFLFGILNRGAGREGSPTLDPALFRDAS